MKNEIQISPLLLTTKEAAQSLGLSRASFYSLVSEGKIKKVKIRNGRSGAVRFRPSDLNAFINSHVQ